MSNERQEIEQHGFITDEFLATDPDCPVFGINLACAYPFPASAEPAYTDLADRLAKLDDGVYVYPMWETHVTLITFINFSRHKRPSPQQVGELGSLVPPVLELLRFIIDSKKLGAFQIELSPPILSRKAGILPVSNPSGEITRIRQWVRESLDGNAPLRERVLGAGLNIPGIIHSTILRFKQAPGDVRRFLAEFDSVAAATKPFSFSVNELLLTAEPKPYMRAGEVLHRFRLPV